MKIIKLSQDFQMLSQNPSGAVNPGAQLQNLQNSQQALQSLQAAMQALSEVLAAVGRLDEALGIDSGIRATVEQTANAAIMRAPAFDLLSKMGFVANISSLQDTNKFTQLQQMLVRNIQDYNSGMGQTQKGSQGAMQGMGYQ